MKNQNQVSNPLQNIIRFVLVSLCVMLVITLWLQLNPSASNDEDNSVMDVSANSKNNEVDNKKFVFPKITAFDEVIQRPLFNETRLPFVAPEPEHLVAKPESKRNRPAKKQEELSLSAVVMTPEIQIAILQSGRNKTLQRVVLGEMIDGWSLDEVTPHSVQLKRGEEIKRLELEIKGSNPKSNTKIKVENRISTNRKADADEKNEIPKKQVLAEKGGGDKQSNPEAAVVKK